MCACSCTFISYRNACLCSSEELVDTVIKAMLSCQINGLDSFIVCHCHISSVQDEELQNLQLKGEGGDKEERIKEGLNE